MLNEILFVFTSSKYQINYKTVALHLKIAKCVYPEF